MALMRSFSRNYYTNGSIMPSSSCSAYPMTVGSVTSVGNGRSGFSDCVMANTILDSGNAVLAGVTVGVTIFSLPLNEAPLVIA